MKFFIKAILVLLPFIAIGQNKTYLGVEIGPKFEVYRNTDNGNGLYTKPFFFSPIYGLTIGQEINNLLTAETGFFINDYGESYRIEGESNFYRSSNAILAYQIPLRLKARIKLVKDRLSIVPTVGYTLAINTDYGSTGSGYSFTTGFGPQFNDSTRTEETSTYSLKKTYGLIETGIALEYKLKNPLTLYLSTNYLIGFNRIVEIDVKYWIDDGPEQTGTVFSNGDFVSVVFGIKYPISKLWTRQPAD